MQVFIFYLNKSDIPESNPFTSEANFNLLIFLLLEKATLQNLLVKTEKITYMEDLRLEAKPVTLTFHSLANIHSLYVKIK